MPLHNLHLLLDQHLGIIKAIGFDFQPVNVFAAFKVALCNDIKNEKILKI